MIDGHSHVILTHQFVIPPHSNVHDEVDKTVGDVALLLVTTNFGHCLHSFDLYHVDSDGHSLAGTEVHVESGQQNYLGGHYPSIGEGDWDIVHWDVGLGVLVNEGVDIGWRGHISVEGGCLCVVEVNWGTGEETQGGAAEDLHIGLVGDHQKVVVQNVVIGNAEEVAVDGVDWVNPKWDK